MSVIPALLMLLFLGFAGLAFAETLRSKANKDALLMIYWIAGALIIMANEIIRMGKP